MRRKLRSPLAPRNGLDPVRLRLPASGPWATVRDHMVERLPRVAPERIDEKLRAGEIVGANGPVAPGTPFLPDAFLWFHRDLPVEVPVPFELRIVHRDENIVVAHKPHFLATIPRGRHVRETALVRLREQLGCPELSPAHRLDRATAGLLLFVVAPRHRGAYQSLFARRRVTKIYEAISNRDPTVELPATVRSRIVKERGIVAAYEVPGEPNAETAVELAEHRDGLGRYLLRPATGRTHQLRLHMNSLGLPILGDDFYPVVTGKPLDDFRRPLQLLARTLEFTDPLTGRCRRFDSPAALQAWTGYDNWAGAGGAAERTA